MLATSWRSRRGGGAGSVQRQRRAALAGDATTLRATGWILDDDGSGNKLALFTLAAGGGRGRFGVKQANFEVSLSRPAPEAFSVSYTTVDGSALAGEDYTATSGTLELSSKGRPRPR